MSEDPMAVPKLPRSRSDQALPGMGRWAKGKGVAAPSRGSVRGFETCRS